MRKAVYMYAKTKTQISCAVTTQLISAYAFASRKVKPIFFNPKFLSFFCDYTHQFVLDRVGNYKDKFLCDPVSLISQVRM